MQIFVPNIGLASLRSPCPSESSAAVQSRVLEARARQARRLARYGLRTNAEMGARATRETCPLGAEAERTLERLHQVRRGMTARTVDRIIRVSRTVADLTGADEIDAGSLLEAAGYRTLDTDPLVDPRTLLSGRPATRS